MKKKFAILGEYTPTFQSHILTDAAIQHSCSWLSTDVEGSWVSTENISDSIFDVYAGILVAPGSPYKNMDKMLWAIRYARENGIPCLGTCGGFQLHIFGEWALPTSSIRYSKKISASGTRCWAMPTLHTMKPKITNKSIDCLF